MSAYIVEDETINKILAWLYADSKGSRKVATHLLNRAGWDVTNPAMLRGLGHEMFRLNIYAVDQRYGEGEAASFRGLDYEFRALPAGGIVPTIKTLQCLVYQCSEGDAVERPLYALLRDIEFAMCRKCVEGMPEYEKAAWG